MMFFAAFILCPLVGLLLICPDDRKLHKPGDPWPSPQPDEKARVLAEHALDCENIIKERDAIIKELIDALERCRFYAEDGNKDVVIHIVKMASKKWENPE